SPDGRHAPSETCCRYHGLLALRLVMNPSAPNSSRIPRRRVVVALAMLSLMACGSTGSQAPDGATASGGTSGGTGSGGTGSGGTGATSSGGVSGGGGSGAAGGTAGALGSGGALGTGGAGTGGM